VPLVRRTASRTGHSNGSPSWIVPVSGHTNSAFVSMSSQQRRVGFLSMAARVPISAVSQCPVMSPGQHRLSSASTSSKSVGALPEACSATT
jgi:hypothetical protein